MIKSRIIAMSPNCQLSQKITMIEHYENHSSAIKKNNAIIRKIEKEGSDLL